MTDYVSKPLPTAASTGTFAVLNELRISTKKTWDHIAKAVSESDNKMTALAGLAEDLLPPDEGAFVVFGSLARSEFTSGSDLDWAVLIDARADSRHLKIVQELRPRLYGGEFKRPGPTELFGDLVFSHELIHAIGGDEDTNKNMTRRLLLLLESAPVPVAQSEAVHNRIVNAILYRYVVEDASFLAPNDPGQKLPRFLLNDVVRFWRTMAVDYANKYRSRAGDKWALRNIKLRMSRKLLFVSGLLMCISWRLKPQADDPKTLPQNLVEHLREWTKRPPLESLAMIVRDYAPSLAADIFDSYDCFLGLLNDDTKRKSMEELSPEAAYKDEQFLEARKNSDTFDEALRQLLFESKEIPELAKRYGVF